MAKAVLIMDMPESCKDCSIRFTDEYSDYCPCKTQDVFDYVHTDTKPEWCPLKEVPRIMDIKKAATMTSLTWCEGWNACIDKILGGAENDKKN